jgi:Fungal Zn(2)-Cys(6) binuclear cluster domain
MHSSRDRARFDPSSEFRSRMEPLRAEHSYRPDDRPGSSYRPLLPSADEPHHPMSSSLPDREGMSSYRSEHEKGGYRPGDRSLPLLGGDPREHDNSGNRLPYFPPQRPPSAASSHSSYLGPPPLQQQQQQAASAAASPRHPSGPSSWRPDFSNNNKSNGLGSSRPFDRPWTLHRVASASSYPDLSVRNRSGTTSSTASGSHAPMSATASGSGGEAHYDGWERSRPGTSSSYERPGGSSHHLPGNLLPPPSHLMGSPRAGAPPHLSGGGSGQDSGMVTASSSSSNSNQNSPPTQQAATLTVTRKQNSACDACRRRKVRCIRNDDEKQCALCKTKGIECT